MIGNVYHKDRQFQSTIYEAGIPSIKHLLCWDPEKYHFILNDNNFESLYWMKHFSLRLAVVNVCPVILPSELLLSTHLPTSERWTAELTVGLYVVVPTTGFEPARVDLA